MTVAAVENAMRVAASNWASKNGFAFAWDNGPVVDPTAVPTLVWEFQVADESPRTIGTTVATGFAVGTLYLPAGRGALIALQVAENLRDSIAGGTFAGATAEPDASIGPLARDGISMTVEVSIPWELDEPRRVVGAIGVQGEASDSLAYAAFRERWDALVRVPLGLRSFFDDSPPDAALTPPWCFASWRTLTPVQLEGGLQRVPGRVIAALNYPLATGVQAANTAASAIASAFHQCTVRGVVFGTPATERVGRTPLNTWQTNVRLPFHYDVRI